MVWLRLVCLWLLLASGVCAAAGDVIQLRIDGPIGPATSEYVLSGLETAGERQAELVVLQMDTPGGLDTAMRDIIRGIIDSPVPVASYVAPGGARAASAGTYILYASHVAAMAPGTNLGAATPVRVGGMPGSPSGEPGGEDAPGGDGDKADNGGSAMEKKMVNDAVAYIRSLAELRQRNADWAEKAVREAASLPAEEARAMNVVDLVAADMDALLAGVDGRTVDTARGEITLKTAGAAVTELLPDWRNRLLAVITNPNVAYVLMLIGIYGLIFELANPGAVVPGVIGGIALLLALFAFQALPVNYAGLALMALGIMFMIGEAFVPSFGALGLGGAVAFAVGSVLLLDTDSEGFRISLYLVAGFTLASLVVFIGAATLAIRAHRRPVATGTQEMEGSVGRAVGDFQAGRGHVHVHGELWQADSDQSIQDGDRVRVTAMEGLRLRVRPESGGDP
ncbi:nodulation protein NfeD [Ectothiorhodospiraceae bacterium WFHF3C12]|nr:nodulation protein NfeD [Ectothiorhodospiraceae bacterium WFHF3C12]